MMLRKSALVVGCASASFLVGWLAIKGYEPIWRAGQEDAIREAIVRFEIDYVTTYGRSNDALFRIGPGDPGTPNGQRVQTLQLRLAGHPRVVQPQQAVVPGARVHVFSFLGDLQWQGSHEVFAQAWCRSPVSSMHACGYGNQRSYFVERRADGQWVACRYADYRNSTP